MNKISIKNNMDYTVKEAFETFQKFNEAKLLSKETLKSYDNAFKVFRRFL